MSSEVVEGGMETDTKDFKEGGLEPNIIKQSVVLQKWWSLHNFLKLRTTFINPPFLSY